MLTVYIVIAAALIPFLNLFFDLFRKSYSWWLVPVLFIAFLLALIIIHLIVFAISVSLIKLDSNQDKFSKYYRTLVDLTLPMLFKLGRVHIEVTGEDKIPENRRFLLTCNHLNNVDPAVLINCFPNAELGFIGKKEIYTEMPFVARAMHKLHCLPIDRENNREAVKTIIKASKFLSDDVVSVGIFPEGYTSKDGNLQPMRNGAFKIATKAKAPIVVCTLNNTPMIFKNMFRKRTDVTLDVLHTFYPEDYENLSTTEIGDKVYSMMLENITKRRSEIK